jgi:hypothetical protein
MTSAPSIIIDQTHRRADVLVDPNWLEEHLDDPQVRLVEVDVSATAYNQGHIPGAVLWNVYSDLKDSEYRLLDAGGQGRPARRRGYRFPLDGGVLRLCPCSRSG